MNCQHLPNMFLFLQPLQTTVYHWFPMTVTGPDILTDGPQLLASLPEPDPRLLDLSRLFALQIRLGHRLGRRERTSGVHGGTIQGRHGSHCSQL